LSRALTLDLGVNYKCELNTMYCEFDHYEIFKQYLACCNFETKLKFQVRI